MSELKEKLRILLLKKNVSATDIEKKTGLNKNTVYSILAGNSKKPTLKTLNAIAKILAIPVESLLSNNKTNDNPIVSHQHIRTFAEATVKTVDMIIHKDYYLSFNELLSIIQEIYLYTQKDNSHNVDSKFIDWLLEQKAILNRIESGKNNKAS